MSLFVIRITRVVCLILIGVPVYWKLRYGLVEEETWLVMGWGAALFLIWVRAEFRWASHLRHLESERGSDFDAKPFAVSKTLREAVPKKHFPLVNRALNSPVVKVVGLVAALWSLIRASLYLSDYFN